MSKQTKARTGDTVGYVVVGIGNLEVKAKRVVGCLLIAAPFAALSYAVGSWAPILFLAGGASALVGIFLATAE